MKSFHTFFSEFQIMSICSLGGCRGRKQHVVYGVFHGVRSTVIVLLMVKFQTVI